MLRPVRRLTAALLGLSVALSGCGGTPDAEKVRVVVENFGEATAAKDYQRLCDELLAPKLVEEVERVGLPCEAALRQGLGEVEAPTLTIGTIEIRGDDATAEVRTAASGERPSRDVLELIRFGDGWRIASLN
jgi:putative lumazine-binding protein